MLLINFLLMWACSIPVVLLFAVNGIRRAYCSRDFSSEPGMASDSECSRIAQAASVVSRILSSSSMATLKRLLQPAAGKSCRPLAIWCTLCRMFWNRLPIRHWSNSTHRVTPFKQFSRFHSSTSCIPLWQFAFLFFNTIIIILLENLLLFIFIICFRSGERAGRFECHWVLRKPPGTTNATEGTGPECWDCELKIRNQSSKSKPLKFESKLSNARSAQRNASYLPRNWFICLCLLSANCFVHFVRPFEFLIKNFWFILVIFWMASSSITWASKRQNVRRDCSAECYFSCCLVNKRWKVRVSREFGRFSSDRYRSLQFI